jgi:hypothetical protein
MRNYAGIILRYRLWIPALCSMMVILLMPLCLSQITLPQALTIRGTLVQEDSRAFHRFIESIKRENGVLIIGTSETDNKLSGSNYWNVLNNEKENKHGFSVIAGAGRDPSVYFPLILNHPELFKGLRILVYINPTYWRFGLNNFNNDYFIRYVSRDVAIRARSAAKQRGLYQDFMKPALYDSIALDNLEISLRDKIQFMVREFRSYFFYDFKRLLDHSEDIEKKKNISFPYSDAEIAQLKKGLNLDYNVQDGYLSTNNLFPSIDIDSQYRYKVLFEFINLCKENDILATFYLGPYNAIYCNKKNPELASAYEDVLKYIRMIVSDSGYPLIDGTDQSKIPGTFIDVQHFSKYGAYLSAKQIKEHYEKIN